MGLRTHSSPQQMLNTEASEETRQGPAQDPRHGTRVHSQADEPVNGDAKDLHRIQGKTQECKGL